MSDWSSDVCSSDLRAALLDYQRRYAATPPGGQPGAVLDGRDIGTVVCPEAAVKLFVTARDEVRATRRHKELIDKGENPTYDQVLADLRRRDAQDQQIGRASCRERGWQKGVV